MNQIRSLSKRRPQHRFRPRVEALEDRTLLSADFLEFIDPHPAPGNKFGETVLPLSTGNVVITSPFDDAGGTDAGAVYLFSGATGALISTLLGSSPHDKIGSRSDDIEFNRGGVTAIANGNYVVVSPHWDNGTATDAGAVTFGSGTMGISGVISASNSLVGSTVNDRVGLDGVTSLSNGNYVVISSTWNGAAATVGAVTFGSGTTGISGAVNASNSLVGSTDGDQVGSGGVTALSNGNYVVSSPAWHRGITPLAGAVTFGNGTSGSGGEVSQFNSVVGFSPSSNLQPVVVDNVNGHFYAAFIDDIGFDSDYGGRVYVGSQVDGFSLHTSTTLASSDNPSVYNQTVTFTATVSAALLRLGPPTGTVTFLDNGAPIPGCENVTVTATGFNTAQATCTTATLPLGTHVITATYNPDNGYAFTSSTSADFEQVVEQAEADTATVLTSSPNPSIYNQTVTFTATVTTQPPAARVPTGTVTFLDNGTPIPGFENVTVTATGPNTAQATWTTATLTVGMHVITATYNPDTSDFLSSTSADLEQVVNQRSTTTTLTLVPSTIDEGGSSTLTVTVTDNDVGTAVDPTGTVSFTVTGPLGATPITGVLVSSGLGRSSFSITVEGLDNPGGTVTADYSGDPLHLAGSGGSAFLTVNNVAAEATFSAPNSVTYGDAVTVAFTDPFDPSPADTAAGFRYAFGLDSTALALGTYATGISNPAENFLLDAGTYTIYARIIDKDDGFTQYQAEVMVTPAPLTITADHQTKVYGDADPALTFAASGFEFSDTPSILTGSLARAAGDDVGSYAIGQGTLAAGSNYTIAFTGHDLVITPARLTVTADDAQREYGDPNPEFTGTIVGIKMNDDITAGFSTSAVPTSNVGVYDIVAHLSDPDNRLGNYDVSINNGTLTVTPAALTVDVDDAVWEILTPFPTFSGTISGEKNNESFTVVYTSVADETSTVGSYPITAEVSGATLSNYNVVVNDGTLTVTAAQVRIDIKPESLNIDQKGAISIVIFGSAVFDVTQVSLGGLSFAGVQITTFNRSFADTDSDGRQDLVLKFRVMDDVRNALVDIYDGLLAEDDGDKTPVRTSLLAVDGLFGQYDQEFTGFDAVDLILAGRSLP